MKASSLYEFQAKNPQGQDVPLDQYQGKVLLIVNVASQCGFTPQYQGLEALYRKYKDQGLEILGFPCNQFKGQEPGTDSEIQEFCSLNYGVSFPILSKIEVNGPNTHPLYEYLKEKCPGLLGSKAIKWNFTKFLVDSKGKPIKRFATLTRPEAIEPQIKALLNQRA